MAETPTAIVTGGTNGIGQAITLTLAERGYAVIAMGNDTEQGAATEAALRAQGLQANVMEGDVANNADAERIAGFAMREFGRIDVLCNNAAIRPVGNVLETDEETWDRCFAVNIKGMYLFTRAVLPSMIDRKQGVIINTASGSGYGGMGHIAYCASKGAIFPFTKSLAVDHRQDHIRANAVVPGVTLTGMTDMMPPERIASIGESSVAGRMGMPQDIANAVAFLASDEAATITGAILEVGTVQSQMVMTGRVAGA